MSHVCEVCGAPATMWLIDMKEEMIVAESPTFDISERKDGKPLPVIGMVQDGSDHHYCKEHARASRLTQLDGRLAYSFFGIILDRGDS